MLLRNKGQSPIKGATSTDPAVQYAYEDGIASNEAKYVRPDYVTYPGPTSRRVVYYNYPASGVGAPWHGHLARESQGRLGPAVAGEARGRDARDTRGQDAHGTHGRDAHATLGGRTKYADYTYLGAGTVVKVAYPAVTNTLALTYGGSGDGYSGFDRFGRVVDQKWQNQTGGAVKDQFKYAYDRAGNRTSREVAPDGGNPDANDNYYTYDGLDRLVKSNWGTLDGSGVITDQNADANQAWGLDTVGNWSQFKWDTDGGGDGTPTVQSRTHNTANEIQAISGTNANWVDPAYDAAGNMTAGPQPGYETADANTQLYKYDAWNRLTKIYRDADADDLIDDPGELVATYSYDGQNRRIRKVVEAGESDITYDYYYNESWQVLEVRKGGSANPYEQYVWGVQYIDAPVVRFQDSDTNGTLNNTLYYTYDAQFNVTALIEPDGDVVERYVYDPYGKVTFKAADWSDAASQAKSAYDNEILYCGYRFDPESGNYIVRRRYLTPPLGRWLTPDPIGYGDGMNRYQYVRGNPTACLDPTGLIETEVSRYREYPEGAVWKKADGESYVVEARAQVEGKKCCVKLWLGYTFEWRHYQIWESTTYRRTGEGVVAFGGLTAAFGAGLAAVGLADDITLIGVFDDPITLPGGTAFAIGGGVIALVGYATQGVDMLLNDLPNTTNALIGDFWEWRNVKWEYGPYDPKDTFPCTGNEILDHEVNGKRNLLPEKRYLKEMNPSGSAPGKSPE